MYVPQEQLNGRVTFYWRISRLFRTAIVFFFSVGIFFECASIWIALASLFFCCIVFLPLFGRLLSIFTIDRDSRARHPRPTWRIVPSGPPYHPSYSARRYTQRPTANRWLVTLQIYIAAGSTFDGAIPLIRPKRAQSYNNRSYKIVETMVSDSTIEWKKFIRQVFSSILSPNSFVYWEDCGLSYWFCSFQKKTKSVRQYPSFSSAHIGCLPNRCTLLDARYRLVDN